MPQKSFEPFSRSRTRSGSGSGSSSCSYDQDDDEDLSNDTMVAMEETNMKYEKRVKQVVNSKDSLLLLKDEEEEGGMEPMTYESVQRPSWDSHPMVEKVLSNRKPFLLAFAACLGLSLVFNLLTPSSRLFLTSPLSTSSHLAPSQGKGEQKYLAPLCTIDEYNDGRWYPRDLAFSTIQDYKDLFHIHQNPESPRDIGCFFGDGQDVDANLRRTFNATAYKWLPHSGCELVELTRAKLLRYLLRAPAGLMLVGDSLTDEHMFSLNNLLLYPGGPIYSDPPGGSPIKSSLYLNISHAEAGYVLGAAGVPSARAIQPLVVFNREDLLMPQLELANLFREMGIPVSSNLHEPIPELIREGKPNFWLSGNQFEHPGWVEELRLGMTGEKIFPNHAEMASSENWPSGVKKEKSIVLMSVGAHWSPSQLGGLPVPILYEAYRRMVEVMISRVELMQPWVQGYFRATSPGHVNCGEHRKPDPFRIKQANPDVPDEEQPHMWFMIEALNDIVKETIEKRLLSSTGGLKEREIKSNTRRFFPSSSSSLGLSSSPQGKVDYLDMWPIANQRPDIHRAPNIDCLHVCGSILETEWTKVLWHAIKLQAKNRREDGSWPDHPYEVTRPLSEWTPVKTTETATTTTTTPRTRHRWKFIRKMKGLTSV